MSILVDSSVWIDYFRDTGKADVLELLIDRHFTLLEKHTSLALFI